MGRTSILIVGQKKPKTHDNLNRLTSGMQSGGGYNHTYNYDSFGNMVRHDNLGSDSSVSFSTDPATNRLLRSHDGGVTWGDLQYDPSGNMKQYADGVSPTVSLAYNATGQVANINGGQTQYLYDANGNRVYKQTPTGTTDYVYFNGQPIAEKDQNGAWTDYIYANGQKIAKVASSYSRLHLTGSSCSTSTSVNVGANNIPISSGDHFAWKEAHTSGNQSFLQIQFSDNTWTDVTGSNPSTSGWQDVSIDMSSFATKTLWGMWLLVNQPTNGGSIDTRLTDLVLVKADGSIIPFYTGTVSGYFSPTVTGCGSSTVVSEVATDDVGSNPQLATRYYLDDHLGTAQMELSSGGWPVWQGQFTPFGQEIIGGNTDNAIGQQPPDGTSMHYKFTGKERDTESGLDYFGARYYASMMGRSMSPDWSAKIEPVPYSKIENPQSLNLYSYVGNNPLSNADTDGHACISHVNASSGFCTRADTYKTFDDRVYGKTRFFAAASAATQELADVAVPGLGMAGTSASTRSFLESTGETLLKTNQQLVAQVESGAITGSGSELDSKLVHIEQNAVQQGLNDFQSKDPTAYGTAITQLNGLLNGKSTTAANALGAVGGAVLSTDGAYGQVLAGVRKSLGHDIDFANQSDREAIGNALGTC